MSGVDRVTETIEEPIGDRMQVLTEGRETHGRPRN
jgi:hypothetical protein